jgi:hypothetical protein
MQQRTYAGPAAVTTGSINDYSYVYSDVVPPDKYWLLFKVSIVQDTDGTAVQGNLLSTLFLLNGSAAALGVGPKRNLAAYGQQPVFLSRKSGAPQLGQICNGGPIVASAGMKIDESTAQDGIQSGATYGWNTPDETLVFGRTSRPLIIPQGFCLLGSNWFNIVLATFPPSNSGIILTMKLLLAEFKNTENVSL